VPAACCLLLLLLQVWLGAWGSYNTYAASVQAIRPDGSVRAADKPPRCQGACC